VRSYGTVASTFWTRGSGKLLRGDPGAQVVALYLMTGPASSMTGIYHLALPTLAHEIGCPIEGACKALRRVCEVEIASYDEADELVWVPKLAFYQIGPSLAANDKRVRGVLNAISQYTGHRFYWEFVLEYGEKYNLGIRVPSKGHRSPFVGACKPLRSQDQDQDQDPLPSEVSPPSDSGLPSTLDLSNTTPPQGARPPAAAPAAAAVGVSVPGSAPPKPEKKRPAAPRHIGRETEVPETDGIGRARRHWAVLWHEKYGSEYPDAPAQDAATLVKLVQHHKRAAIEVPWRTWMADLFKAFLEDPEPFIAQSGHPLRLLQTRLAKYEADRSRVA
jgi:hypothetical protein